MINVAVVGLGHWGPNLARNIAALPDAHLHTLCDIRAERLEHVGRQYPTAKQQVNFDAILSDPDVDAVIIATPVCTHFELASAATRPTAPIGGHSCGPDGRGSGTRRR